MTIIMVAATSHDGFITKGFDPNVSVWTSHEDKELFAHIKSKHSLFIMGRKTYELAKIKPQPGILRVIMTRNPENYKDAEIAGQLEFTDASAQQIVHKYRNSYDSCLLLGGGEIYEQFLDQKLINEIYLTIEPVIHGSGTHLLASGNKLSKFLGDAECTLEMLNGTGTKLLHYAFRPPSIK